MLENFLRMLKIWGQILSWCKSAEPHWDQLRITSSACIIHPSLWYLMCLLQRTELPQQNIGVGLLQVFTGSLKPDLFVKCSEIYGWKALAKSWYYYPGASAVLHLDCRRDYLEARAAFVVPRQTEERHLCLHLSRSCHGQVSRQDTDWALHVSHLY